MVTLEDFAPAVQQGINWAESIPMWLGVLLAFPLALAIGTRLLPNLSNLSEGEAIAILGLVGVAGGLAQVLGSQLLKDVNRPMHIAEVFIPVVAILAASGLLTLWLLPPGRFNAGLRDSLRSLRLL